MKFVILGLAGIGLAAVGCTGDAGKAGADGAAGTNGAPGADGESCTATDNGDGTYTLDCDGNIIIVSDGVPGVDGESCTVTDNGDGTYNLDCGGEIITVSDGAPGANGAGLASENCVACHNDSNIAAVSAVHLVKEYTHPAPDVEYTATITNAEIVAATGAVEITFNIKDNHGYFVEVGPYRYAGPLSSYDVRFYLAKLELDASDNFNWKRVVYERGSDGTFVDNNNGSYTFTSDAIVTDGFVDVDYPARDAAYDGSNTYRAGISFGGHAGPASSPTYDFRPVDNETDPTIIDSRNIVATATCVKCHGNEFSGHGGDRKTVENCVLCHNPTTNMEADDLVNNEKFGEMDSSAMSIMIHNIHSGNDDYWIYRSRSGGNWYNWGENPTNEPRATHTMTFPQPSYKCTACHEADTATMSDGLVWQQKPTRSNCGESCHTDVDFTLDDTTTHDAGQQLNDDNCAGCHNASNIGSKHSTANTDIISAADLALDTPEYTVAITMLDNTGTEITSITDVAGMAAQVKIVISDGSGPIDHTDVANFHHANLFVYGPRSQMNPVLTTAAAAGGLGYYASNNLKNDTKATITAESIIYQLDVADGLKAGTYAAYVDVCNVAGDATDGYQAPGTAIANFQVGTTKVEKQVAGNCMACHGDTIMHGGKDSSHRHDTTFDAERCGACHDYTNGSPTATSYQWFGGNPISKRVHAVHAAATLIDPDYTVGHAPAVAGHEWSHILYPAALNDCAGTCHNPANSTDAWKTNPNQLACMGCHDTPEASDHALLMGGEPAPEPVPAN